MARARNKLTARQVAALVSPGRYSDGGSLYLAVDGEGDTLRRRWLFFFTRQGRRREMGLGGFPAVALGDARKARDEAEKLLREGRDPIAARDDHRRQQAQKPTFGQAADALIAAKRPSWRSKKHELQWESSLSKEAVALRPKLVDEVDTAAVMNVLSPLWTEKPETAARLRSRIEAVLDWATAQGHRQGANPATWRGHLSHLLPKHSKLDRGHHQAMAYTDIPSFILKLRKHQSKSIAAMALEVTILTATRSGEIYGAQWNEIDIDNQLWVIPPKRMKAAREHRIPLSDRVVAILKCLPRTKGGELVFESPRGGRLSHVSMAKVLSRLGYAGPTVHGFRSAFRDWVGDRTAFPREVAEAALAHIVGDKAEQAYRRGDALEKRRQMMIAWAEWCEPREESNVVLMHGRSK